MVQLAWFTLPCSILFMISTVSFNYGLSIAAGSLDALLVAALFVKIHKINSGQIEKEQAHPW